MSKAFRIVLMVCAIILVVAISGSMIYYFAFAKPGNERAEREWEKEKLRKEEEQRKEEDRKELQREQNLRDCLSNAYDNYNENWKSAAKRLDSKDNTLPTDVAARLNEGNEKQQEQCFKLYGP